MGITSISQANAEVPAGLRLITPTSIANSGGSSSASGGAITFSAVNSISLNGVFSGSYDDYRLQITITSSSTANTDWAMRLRVGGTDSTASYLSGRLYQVSTTVVGSAFATDRMYCGYTPASSGPPSFGVIEIAQPFATAQTAMHGHSGLSDGSNVYNEITSAVHTSATSYDGLTLYPATGTITGTVRVYAYLNA